MGLFSKTGAVAALIYAASIGAAPSHYADIRVAPDIKVDFQFYRVSGSDVAAVMRQITALSPTSLNRRRAATLLDVANASSSVIDGE